MNSFYLLVLCTIVNLTTSNIIDNSKTNSLGIIVNINDLVDKKLIYVRQQLYEHHLDPCNLPDETEQINYPILSIIHATLNVTDGLLKDIHTIERNGEAKLHVAVTGKELIEIPLRIADIKFHYNYSLQMNQLVSPYSGGINGSAKNIEIYASAYYHVFKKYVEIVNVTIDDLGKITVDLTGHPVADFVADRLINSTIKRIHQQLQDKINEILAILIKYINNELKP